MTLLESLECGADFSAVTSLGFDYSRSHKANFQRDRRTLEKMPRKKQIAFAMFLEAYIEDFPPGQRWKLRFMKRYAALYNAFLEETRA